MRYLELCFRARLTAPALFSAYKGSMLRGALGARLRDGLCMTRKNECPACVLAPNCLFLRLFIPAAGGSAPFCLEPGDGDKREYAEGDHYSFKLKLFAYAVEYAPFYVQAFRMSGEKGLGSAKLPGRFIIEEITAGDVAVYADGEESVKIPAARNFPEIDRLPVSAEPKRLLLRLVSPLRHKNDNRFAGNLPFVDFFHLVLRRIKALRFLNGETWSLERDLYERLRKIASGVETEANGLYWRDWTRYSSRQDAYMKFGGLLGEIAYRGDLSPFEELVKIAAIAHIGKQTSFGLGQTEYVYL